MSNGRSKIGLEIEAGLTEALAHAKGEVALESRIVPPNPERIQKVRKGLAKSREAFEALYGIPARTVQDWEQGRRRPDLAASAYLAVIEEDPEAVAAMYAKARGKAYS